MPRRTKNQARLRRENGHGGQRAGRPGANYQNRKDMAAAPRTAPAQPIRTTDQGYGTQVQQAQAQQAVPLPDFSALSLSRPTERPNEPVTAGVPAGPGPGPEILGPLSAPEAPPVLEMLQRLYAEYPSNDLRSLVEEAQSALGP